MTLVYQFIMKINFINFILVIGFIICQTSFCVNILFIEKFPKDLKLVQTFSLANRILHMKIKIRKGNGSHVLAKMWPA